MVRRLTLVLFVLVTSTASAAPVPFAVPIVNLSTGINPTTGAKLPDGTPDPPYVVAAGSTAYTGQTLVAKSDSLPPPYIQDGDSSASRWIGINSGSGIQGISVPAGPYVLDATVNLTGYAGATASIPSSQFAVDDASMGIQINGVSFYAPPGGLGGTFGSWTPLPDNLGLGLFHDGVNTITFDVTNAVFSPMALRFEGTVTAAPSPPSPACSPSARWACSPAAGGPGELAR